MISDKLNLLSRAMTAYARRMDAISGNIANMDTPGYRKVTVSFEDRLQEVLQGPDGKKNAGLVSPQITIGEEAPVLEDELMDMADTQMRNQLAAKALSGHFGMLRTSITGRTG
jgi:flagellar basal-body rod protein FlgB